MGTWSQLHWGHHAALHPTAGTDNRVLTPREVNTLKMPFPFQLQEFLWLENLIIEEKKNAALYSEYLVYTLMRAERKNRLNYAQRFI